jgi:hypothetical protein
MKQDSLPVTMDAYEAPRLEPAAGPGGPRARTHGGPIDAWNIVCNDCSSGGN